MSEHIQTRIKKLASEHLGVDIDKVTPEASIMDDLGADSLDQIELCMAIEEEFEIDVPDARAEGWKTIGDAINGVTEILGSRA